MYNLKRSQTGLNLLYSRLFWLHVAGHGGTGMAHYFFAHKKYFFAHKISGKFKKLISFKDAHK